MHTFLEQYPQKNGVYYLTDPDDSFEAVYVALRQKEQRLYPDEEVRRLPLASAANPHHEEWEMRAKSFDRLINYFENSSEVEHVLDLGCGNGWLSRHLSRTASGVVMGMDVNRTELEQAGRLFAAPDCCFAYGEIFRARLPENYFSHIILCSVIQYFEDFNHLIHHLFGLLKKDGEIHLLDSPLYQDEERAAARRRSRAYYRQLDMEQMADHYFHHGWQELDAFPHQLLYPRNTLGEKISQWLAGKDVPFPWVRFTEKEFPD